MVEDYHFSIDPNPDAEQSYMITYGTTEQALEAWTHINDRMEAEEHDILIRGMIGASQVDRTIEAYYMPESPIVFAVDFNEFPPVIMFSERRSENDD